MRWGMYCETGMGSKSEDGEFTTVTVARDVWSHGNIYKSFSFRFYV